MALHAAAEAEALGNKYTELWTICIAFVFVPQTVLI
jgi:hypothetical protein